MRRFSRLIESQIAKARSALTGLKGEGKPLPDLPVETGEQAVVSAGMRMMAQAGVMPEEFTIKKQLDAAKAAYASATDPDDRKAQMSRISSLELRYNIAVEARRKFMR